LSKLTDERAGFSEIRADHNEQPEKARVEAILPSSASVAVSEDDGFGVKR
jgi:hypothetical protein